MTSLVIVGAGRIATEYTLALKHLGITPVIVGRGDESADALERRCGVKVMRGGLESYVESGHSPELAIIAVDHLDSFRLSKMLLEARPRALLLEKPGALRLEELEELRTLADSLCEDTRIALNRRYLLSIRQTRQFLQASGSPIERVHVTFDERISRLRKSDLPPAVLERWIWVQSIHVIDAALHLSGDDVSNVLKATRQGRLPWHPSGSRFLTDAELRSGVPIRFNADWRRDGLWSIYIVTQDFEVRLAPIEEAYIKDRSPASSPWRPLYRPSEPLVKNAAVIKPGFVDMVQDFVDGSPKNLPSVDQHLDLARLIFDVAGYE